MFRFCTFIAALVGLRYTIFRGKKIAGGVPFITVQRNCLREGHVSLAFPFLLSIQHICRQDSKAVQMKSSKSRELIKKRLNTMQPDNCFNILGGYNGLILLNFNLKGENTMRIIFDTEKGRIILPQSFFPQLDKMNKILVDSKVDKKWTPEDKVVK